ncbi:MAG: T9SS type A sorting domain-containing protein [Bacteroidetes bacterium]|nr:MAG: T9SS type A sorting domain-containing protein [Bacteroidota bacterium]
MQLESCVMKTSKIIFLLFFILSAYSFQLSANNNIIWEKEYSSDSLVNIVPSYISLYDSLIFLTYNGSNPNQKMFRNSGIICLNEDGEFNWKYEIIKEKPFNIIKLNKNNNYIYLIGTYTPYAVSPLDPEQINYLLNYQLSTSGSFINEFFDKNNDSAAFLGGIVLSHSNIYYVASIMLGEFQIKEYDSNCRFVKKIVTDLDFNGSPIFAFSDIVLTNQNEFIVLTRHASTYQWGEEYSYIRCIDKNGKTLWKTKLDIEGKYLNLFKVIETKNKEFILLGRTYQDISSYHATLNKSIAIFKVDTNGNVLWNKEYKVDSTTYIDRNIVEINKGKSYLLYGKTKKITWDDTTQYSSNFKFCIVEINENGELLPNALIWNKSLERDNYISDVKELIDGYYLAYGKSDTNLYLANVFMSPTSVSKELNFTQENILVYPNPVNNYLLLKSNKDINKVEIFSALGIEVMETEYKDRINVSGLSAGVYFIRIGDKVIQFVKM